MLRNRLIIILIVFMVFCAYGCTAVNSNSVQNEDVYQKTPPLENIDQNQYDDIALSSESTKNTNEIQYDDVALCSDNEIVRAVNIGIGYYLADNPEVTFAEFFSMLDNAVKILDESKLELWQKEFNEARSSDTVMRRIDGMFALFYAAKTLGDEYMVFNSPFWDMESTMDVHWDDLFEQAMNLYNRDVFGSFDHLINQTALLYYSEAVECSWEDNIPTQAYQYSFGRKSLTSGKTLFDYSEESRSMRISDPLLNNEALLAILRLYDSTKHPASDRKLTEADQIILNAADSIRSSIINSPTNILVQGTAYYVSNRGNDNNDGLSPETAWATLDKVNSACLNGVNRNDQRWNNNNFPEFIWASNHGDECAVLNPGDAVFFERGGVWRGILCTVSGVTYSAYGEGEKPQIYGSPENGSGVEKWSLVEGTENVWLYYKKIQDCGGILLNEDTTATKQLAFWYQNEYYRVNDDPDCEEFNLSDFEVYNVTMLEDLRFFNDIRYEKYSESLLYGSWGNLYLRCDAGNPGEIYSSIEFFTGNDDWNQGTIAAQDNCVIDNLCVKFGVAGIQAQGKHDVTIQNCEVGWIGGMIGGFDASGLGLDYAISVGQCGDGILIGGKNNRAINNYVYQVFDWAITIEGYLMGDENTKGFNDELRNNCEISSNLIEDCAGGALVASWYAYHKNIEANVFNNTDICNNVIMNSGEGWAYHEYMSDCNIAGIGVFLNPGCDNVRILNNLLYLTSSEDSLITVANKNEQDYFPEINGNIYAQYDFGNVFLREMDDANPYMKYYTNGFLVNEDIVKVLNDKTGLVLALQYARPNITIEALQSKIDDMMSHCLLQN